MLRRFTLPFFLLAPLLWLFRSALFAGEVLAFRDVGHFYYPLYQYVQQQWRHGIPLWNPLDGLGQPLLGDPTAAVLYPGKIIFELPLSFSLCLTLYVIGHLLLAGYGAYFFSRELKANRHGAILAGVSYELSGQVLFQYCNPIYLVGAAWLPWALLFVHRIGIGKKPIPSMIGLSITLCFMVLGGEPQMAMHVVLCSFVWAIITFASKLRKQKADRLAGPPATRFMLWIAIACMLALGLAAAQILPSMEWSERSDRGLRNGPRSCSELVVDYAINGATNTAGLWNRNTLSSKHATKTYDFSVGPWRWSECFWPNISGHFAPISTRWIRALPGEGRMWTASLYLGLLPICLAVFRCRFIRGSRAVRWISWLTLLSMLAAIGEYGVGWLIDEYQFQVTGNQFERSPIIKGFGGLYWFLTIVVPGYADFRYPGKWWTVASLGISVLAARGLPLIWSRYRQKLVTRFATCSVVALSVTLVCRFLFIESVPSSSAFGPFDESLSLMHLLQAVLHTVVCGAACWMIGSKSRATAMGLVILTVIELTFAQQTLIHTAADTNAIANEPGGTIWREATPMYPSSFRDSASADRIHEMREHDVQSLMPKHHLLRNTRQLNSISSMHCADFHSVWTSLGTKHKPSQQTLNFFGATPSNESPTAWLVFRWKRSPTKNLKSLSEIEQQTRNILLSESGELIDHRSIGIVETNDEIPTPSDVASNQNVSVVSTNAKRIEIRVTTSSEAALLVLREQFYPGWVATVSNQGSTTKTKIYRTNRVMRGVFVPAGESTVVLQYRPQSFFFGALISIICWTTLGAYLALTGQLFAKPAQSMIL